MESWLATRGEVVVVGEVEVSGDLLKPLPAYTACDRAVVANSPESQAL